LHRGFWCEEILHLVAKGFPVRRAIKRDLAKKRFEVVAGQRLNREEIRLLRVEVRFQFGIGKNDAALATITECDPLSSFAVLLQEVYMFGGSSGGLLFQPFFDIAEPFVEEDEIEEKGVSAFN